MPLPKAPALTPGRWVTEGLDSRLCGNGGHLGREPIRATGRTPFGSMVREKNFFIGFKAGMLLKTRERRTKCTNGQVPGVRCHVHVLGGLRSFGKNSPPQVNTPAPSAPPLLNQRLWSAPEWAPSPPEDSGVSHYVYEKTRTYRKFVRNGLTCMSLMINELSVSGGCGAQKKGTPYLKDRAIILLKTHIEKMSDNGLAIISMKIKGLFDSCHYVYENKPT